MSNQPRPVPRPTPETAHFWEGAAEGVLRLQRCVPAGHVYFPPRPFCPVCSTREIEVVDASGRATLYSYVISHRDGPGNDAPYAIAVVELEEGPRMMTNITGCPQTPEALRLDMALEVHFEVTDDGPPVPLFHPTGVSS